MLLNQNLEFPQILGVELKKEVLMTIYLLPTSVKAVFCLNHGQGFI